MSTKVASFKHKPEQLEELKNSVISAILDKKGEEVVSLDLRTISDAVSDYFIICHATSTTQVKAIADNIIEHTKETLGESPWHKEGFENLEWVLIDYVNVVVHVFLKDVRTFYRLEELWNDAEREEF